MTGTDSGLTDLPRAVLSAAAGMLHTVGLAMVGADRVRTARQNAWEAVCADRDRARTRAEIRRLAADLAVVAAARPLTAAQFGTGPAAAQLLVGSSPRSSASHADLVGSAPGR